MVFYQIRRELAKKLGLPFLTGRDKHLTFNSKDKKVIMGYQVIDDLPDVKQLIFLHIPKTAGSSVIAILKYMASREKKIYLKISINDYVPGIKMIPGWLGAWNDAERIESNIIEAAGIVTGHFPFGIHRGNSAKYFTLLRCPVAREISSFNYLYQTGGLEKDTVFDTEVFTFIDNPQTRILAGIDGMKKELCDDETYAMALENLEKYFLLFGPAEKTDEVLGALISLMKWPSLAYYPSNLTKMKLINEISEDLHKKIQNYHCFDVKLHRYACEHWDEIRSVKFAKERDLSSDNVLTIPRDI